MPTTKVPIAFGVLVWTCSNLGSTLTIKLNGRFSISRCSVGTRLAPIIIGEEGRRSTTSCTSTVLMTPLERERLDAAL